MKTENMTDEEKRWRILEASEWKNVRRTTILRNRLMVEGWWGVPPDGERDEPIPDPLEDLNAMHDALMAQPQEFRDSVNHALMESQRPSDAHVLDRTINATARQRADAFLMTL